MKRTICILFAIIVITVLLIGRSSAADGAAIGAVARFHKTHLEFQELPVTDDDISYGATFEFHENKAYWQFSVLYADTPGTNNVEFIVSPQVNLIFSDNYWVGGMGILTSYIDRGEEDSEWLDPYWQMVLGLRFPIGPLQVEGTAYYVFEKWDEVAEFEFDEVEYGVSVSYYF